MLPQAKNERLFWASSRLTRKRLNSSCDTTPEPKSRSLRLGSEKLVAQNVA